MTEHIPAEPRVEVVIEVTVKPQTFRVRVDAEDWDSWNHDERLAWCEDTATEMDKIHFDYVFVGPYHG